MEPDSTDFKVADSPTPPRPEVPMSAGQEYQIIGTPRSPAVLSAGFQMIGQHPVPPSAPGGSSSSSSHSPSSCNPLSEKIDDFFKDEHRWNQVFSEVARSPQLR